MKLRCATSQVGTKDSWTHLKSSWKLVTCSGNIWLEDSWTSLEPSWNGVCAFVKSTLAIHNSWGSLSPWPKLKSSLLFLTIMNSLHNFFTVYKKNHKDCPSKTCQRLQLLREDQMVYSKTLWTEKWKWPHKCAIMLPSWRGCLSIHANRLGSKPNHNSFFKKPLFIPL